MPGDGTGGAVWLWGGGPDAGIPQGGGGVTWSLPPPRATGEEGQEGPSGQEIGELVIPCRP